MFSNVKFRVFVLLTNNGKTVKAFLRTELVNFDCYLAVIFGEGKGGYALTMCLFKSSQALAGGNFPDPNLSSLRSGSQHLAVPGKRQAQDRLFHHHEVVLSLILQIFPDFTGRKIPNLEESVHRSGNEILTVG
jgi:hypothetical protein